jgi:sulfur carrier protein
MKIVVNGLEKEFDAEITLASAIRLLEIEDKVMASAVNMNIVKKENWNSYVLQENDKIELLEFVGGG